MQENNVNLIKMADVAFNSENDNLDELFSQGARAYVLQDFDTAVLAFSKATELLARQYNNDLHDSLGNVYLYYGKSLLQLSRKRGEPFSDGMLKEIYEKSESESQSDDDDDEEEEEEGEPDEQEGENDEKTEEAVENGVRNGEETNGMATSEDEASQQANGNVKTDDEDGESNQENNEETPKETEAKEELTDLQVAWEILELAKIIFTKRGDEGKKNLAETLIVLGEVSLESNMINEGVEDMKKGLDIQKTVYGNDSRIVAETLYKVGMALGSQKEAIEHFEMCIQYLKNRSTKLEADVTKNKEEIDEIKGLISEIEEKINDVKNFKEEIAEEIAKAFKGEDSELALKQLPSSSSSKVNDISHLVKRKRKPDDDDKNENVETVKKPCV